MFVLPNAQIMSLIDDITLKKLDSTFAMTGSLVWPRAYEHPLLPRFKASLLEKLVSRQFMHKPTLAN